MPCPANAASPWTSSGKILLAATFAGAVLLGARAADGDGIDGLEMAGIRNQVNMHLAAAARFIFAGRAHVILHVAAEPRTLRGSTSSKPAKISSGGRLATWAMTLSRPRWLMPMTSSIAPCCAAGVENLVHQRNQRGDAFEREPLAAQITLLHDLLENVGADEEFENALLVFLRRLGFHLLVNPVAPLRPVDVIDFDADCAGINGAGLAGIFTLSSQFGSRPRRQEAERVEISLEISLLAVGGEYAFALRMEPLEDCRIFLETLVFVVGINALLLE